jgi:hypothetical protein
MFREPVASRLPAMTTPTTTETSRSLEPTGHDTFVDDLADLRELDSLGVRFELRVPGADALEAFHHPFAYAG